jgi:hypothetical protein
LFSDGGE